MARWLTCPPAQLCSSSVTRAVAARHIAIGKKVNRIGRQHLLPPFYVKENAPDKHKRTHLGRSSEVATHTARAFLAWAKQDTMSCAAIFTGIVAACYILERAGRFASAESHDAHIIERPERPQRSEYTAGI